MASVFLTGCINFNPKGNKTEETGGEPEVMPEDPADDLAMENSPHLKFKNVPIDGSLDKFVSRMVRSGFKVKEKTDGQAFLNGDFADFKECLVYVETLSSKDLVSRISVRFPDQDQWEYLYGDYRHLKELLTVKYGKPSSCVEKFQSPYGLVPKDDDMRMLYVHRDKCKYETRFTTDKGEIVLWIGHGNTDELMISDRAFVVLSYKDRENGSIIENHAIDDL